MLVDEMPDKLKGKVMSMSEKKMVKVMDMMKIRIRYHRDIQNHKYLFEHPDYTTDLAVKFLRKIKQPPHVNFTILSDLCELVKKETTDKDFNAERLNKVCSMYLYN